MFIAYGLKCFLSLVELLKFVLSASVLSVIAVGYAIKGVRNWCQCNNYQLLHKNYSRFEIRIICRLNDDVANFKATSTRMKAVHYTAWTMKFIVDADLQKKRWSQILMKTCQVIAERCGMMMQNVIRGQTTTSN